MGAELFDWTPVLQLMALGLVVAAGPLAWVWLRNARASPTQRLQALTVLTLFLTFDLVLFGAFTRLTDSGLGCPDWPGCYGSASPIGAREEIAAAQEAMPTGPVTHGKAWVEMVHRYLATGVGVLILTMAAAAWWQWRRDRTVRPGWPTFTLVWVCLQGLFGALTVTMKLFPAIVTLHLLGGLALLALLCVQVVRQSLSARNEQPVAVPSPLRTSLWATAALLLLQLALGGWVSTNYAVLACDTFPRCQGSWWPTMEFAQGFAPWRALGLRADGTLLDFASLTAIHYVHRLVAYGLFAALLGLSWCLIRQRVLVQPARWLIGLAIWQLLTGLSNVVLDWPLIAAVAHTGGAAALVLVMTWALAGSRAAPHRKVARVAA